MLPWWERWPDIYRREIDALDGAGIAYEIDEAAKRSGQIVIRARYPHNSHDIWLTAKYPANFPFTRFVIFAPELGLGRHQNPLDGQLCLIPKSTIYWHQSDTLAQYILERVPHLIEVASSNDHEYVRQEEFPQGEPYSAYYPYPVNKGILIRTKNLPEGANGGTLILGIKQQSEIAVVLAVKDEHGQVVWEADRRLADCYPKHAKGRWLRMESPPATANPARALDAVLAQAPHLAAPKFDGWGDIIGINYREEVQQGVYQDGWIFLARIKNPGKPGKNLKAHFIRALRAGPEDFQSRVPELSPLARKKVAVFGLGCLGAPSALEFARNGVGELRLLDMDYVEPGSTVRWPLGLPAFGRQKSQALREHIAQHYPYLKVAAEDLMIGNPSAVTQEMEVLERILDGVDLVYDATAEWGLNVMLAHFANERKIPYVWVSTTNGVWGGMTGRIAPGRTEGCFSCFGYHINDGTIVLPHEMPGTLVQPIGCADPTFTGASFDSEIISLTGVRLAVSTLCADTEGAYPDLPWDIGVVNFRDKDGVPQVPSWINLRLMRHPSCPNHG